MTGLLSVVIVSFRDAPLLPAAIDSVIAQNDPAIEVLVVDNEPSEAVAEIVRRYEGEPVRLVPGDGTTPGAGRNAGASVATGSLLSFLDADDLWPRGRLASARSALARDRSLDGVFGSVRKFTDHGGPPIADPVEAARIADAPQTGRMITAALLKRASFERVGHFDAETVLGSELDWVARAADAELRFGWLDEVLLLRRSHAANTTRIRTDEYGGYARVLKRVIDRRRGRA